MAASDQFEFLVADFDIDTSGGNDTYTFNNLARNYEVLGGHAYAGDVNGIFAETTRRDEFKVGFKESDKTDFFNIAPDIYAFSAILNSPIFKGFQLNTNTTYKFTVTHDPIGSAVNTAPFKAVIVLLVKPL